MYSFSTARAISIVAVLCSLIHHCMGMEVDAQLVAVPSLRSLALKTIARAVTSSEFDTKRYIQLARKIRKSYIPDEIAVDLIKALKTKQDSYAITTFFEYPYPYDWFYVLLYSKPHTNELCLQCFKTVHIINTLRLEEKGSYKPSKNRTIQSLIAWHPSQSFIALQTYDHTYGCRAKPKIVIIDSHGKVKLSLDKTTIHDSDQKKIAWTHDQSAITKPACYPHAPHDKRRTKVRHNHPSCMCDRYGNIVKTLLSHDKRFMACVVQNGKETKSEPLKTHSGLIYGLSTTTRGFFSLHVVDTQSQTHYETTLRATEDNSDVVKHYSIEWLGATHRLMVYTQIEDMIIFECPDMIKVLDVSTAHYFCKQGEKPCYSSAGDQVYFKVFGEDDRVGLQILDLSLIISDSQLSVHDQLLGCLSMTTRYRLLTRKERDQIRFDKDISDTVVKRKIKSALKRGSISSHTQGD